MLAFLASLVLSALPATPSASVTCVDGPASWDGASVPAALAVADDGPRDYATPAEVDCPTPPPGLAAAPECDVTPPPDLWYRVSQFPESERTGSTLTVGHRARGGRAASSCGAPPSDSGHLAPPHAQPLALTALPVLV